MAKLILTRHGQSEYNLKNLFTGWIDAPLTEKGRDEAKEAAALLKKLNIIPEIAFTSALSRAQDTLEIILKENSWGIHVTKDPALNERNYGDLGGRNKAQTIEEFGKEQVHLWRRSFETRPPAGESLKDTCERSIPYFQEKILPELFSNKDVLVVAHGNSIRSIVKFLENLSPEEIVKIEIKTGEAWIYECTGSLEAPQFSRENTDA